jgi:hypothetical protein
MDPNGNVHKPGDVIPSHPGHLTSAVTGRDIGEDGHLVKPAKVHASDVTQAATGLSDDQHAVLRQHKMGEGGGKGSQGGKTGGTGTGY